jgi:opacity protein-like surface antigen
MSNKWLTTAALAAGIVAIPSVASADTQVRLFGGFSSADDLSDGRIEGDNYDYQYQIDQVDTESGFVVGAAFGVNTGNWTAEVELAHRSWGLDDDDVTVSWTGYYGGDYSYTGAVDGDLTANSLMANAWYNFPSAGNFSFYAGGGAGIADVQSDVGVDFTYYYADGFEDQDGTQFAWQVGGGVQLKTDSGFSYGIGYRYFNVDNIGDIGMDINAHEVVFEFRF